MRARTASAHALARSLATQLTQLSGDGQAPLHLALATHSLAAARALLAAATPAERAQMRAQRNAEQLTPAELCAAVGLDDAELLAELCQTPPETDSNDKESTVESR